MKTGFTLLFCAAMFAASAQQPVILHQSSSPAVASTTTSDNVVTAEFNTPTVSYVQQGNYIRLNMENGHSMLVQGAPDIPVYTFSLYTPWHGGSNITVVGENPIVVQVPTVIPGKGNLVRTVNPAEVPLQEGDTYQQNEFYPLYLGNHTTHIIRNVQGSAVSVSPIRYNPVTGTLEIFTKLHVELVPTADAVPMQEVPAAHGEFHSLFQHHFVNYGTTMRYNPVEEAGRMLIISHTPYASSLTGFVNWKQQRGLETELVTTATTGGSETDIATYIQNYYAQHPDLVYVLLVGDAQHIAPMMPNGSNGLAGPSDNAYAYLMGGDAYPEFFVGRMSAESTQDVFTQVQRAIQYEKNPLPGDWLGMGVGIASSEGPGDDNEMDYQHMRNLRSVLMGYTYTVVDEFYDGAQGGTDAAGNPTPADVTVSLNQGRGIMNYTGHGWQGGCASSGFSSSDILALQNENMLPFFFSVACVNGEFNTGTCFAETWLRARNTAGNPIGAVATLMSTINQYWNPPMEGQDEMNNILAELMPHTKRTFAGISMNGCMQMNDAYGSAGDDMTDTWTVFGDPSLLVRTAASQSMTVTHVGTENVGVASLDVQCNVEGALVCITQNNQILGTGTVSSGSVTINFPAITSADDLTVTATAFNHTPYQGPVDILGGTGITESPEISLTLYPNPASHVLNVSGKGLSNATLRIIDPLGKVCGAYPVTGTITAIEVSHLASGLYFVQVVRNGQVERSVPFSRN